MKAPRLAGGPRTESYGLYALAGALLLAGPVWHYAYTERYPFGPDLLLLVGVPAVVGALIAVAAHGIGGLVETLCFAVLLFVFADLQFAPYRHFPDFAPGRFLLGTTIVLALLLRRHRAALACITLGAFYASALPRTGARERTIAISTAPGRAGLPVLVHVILDEEWGIGGLRAEGDSATASFLGDFYARRGFEVYPAAYSRYQYTFESVPAIMSLGQRAPRELADESKRRPRGFSMWFPTNPYFELLRAQGYAIHVFQPSYIDFCATPATPVASCETRSGNSIANIGYLDGSPVARAMLAGRYFLNIKSHIYARLHPDREVWRRASVGGGLQELRDLRAAIARGPHTGVAYFVHALVPHRPLEVDADCRVLTDVTRRVGFDLPAQLGDSAWAATMALEGGQIRCAHRALGAVLDALDRTVGRDGAVVIVQGDHGSRVFQHDPKQTPPPRLDARQLNGRYSTLLAVRRPAVPGRVAPEPVPVQDFVWRLAGQGFRGPVAPDFRHYVLASAGDHAGADSLRTLTPDAMPWAR